MNPIDATVHVFESQVDVPQRNGCRVNKTFLSVEMPQDIRDFVAIASDPTGQIQTAFCSMDGRLYNGMFDDILEPDALFHYVAALNKAAEGERPQVLSCDEDMFQKTGEWGQPVFKTKLNVDLLYNHNCVTHFLMVEKALIDSIAMSPEGVAGAQDYDLALRSLRKGYGSLGLPAAGEGGRRARPDARGGGLHGQARQGRVGYQPTTALEGLTPLFVRQLALQVQLAKIFDMRDTLATHKSCTVDGGEFGTIKRAQFKG